MHKFEQILHIPESSKNKLEEEFDPILVILEMVSDSFPDLFDKILDF